MKLISMTDFVLEQSEEAPKDKNLHKTNWSLEFEKYSKLIIRYAEFLKQPLKLEMFIPCDENGNVLEEPNQSDFDEYSHEYACNVLTPDGYNNYANACIDWDEAKEKVLFEGFETKDFEQTPEGVLMNSKKWKSVWMIEGRTIEEMVYTKASLTQAAIKQLGL